MSRSARKASPGQSTTTTQPTPRQSELDGLSHDELETMSDDAELLYESIAAFSAIATLAEAAQDSDNAEHQAAIKRIDWSGLARLGDRMRRLSDDCLWTFINEIHDRTRDAETGGAR